MTIYLDNDGHSFSADTEEELVSQMHELSLVQSEDDAAWMKQAAEGAAEISGKPVSYRNAAEFVADLLALGFLKIRGEKDNAPAN